MIKLLIVDDSATETKILQNIFSKEHNIQVVGLAKNGKEAVELTKVLDPDIITMDIHMPVMDGIEAIKVIMSEHPKPIVVISSQLKYEELKMSFRALEAGALSVLEKPVNIGSADFERVRKRIIDNVKIMSEIKVIKRRFYVQPKQSKTHLITPKTPSNGKCELIAIGASVGGPQALKAILSQLPADFPLPITIVQHMTPGFMSGFVKWLDDSIPLHVKQAENNEPLQNSTIYFAPDNLHFQIARSADQLIAKLTKSAPVSGFCPSITVLFESVSKACHNNALGVLLTGMGSDGAQGLLTLKTAKSHTIIQDKESAIVFGMAAVAKDLGAVDKIVELDNIASYLSSFVAPK